MLNGQKLQGPPTAAEVNVMLKQKQTEDKSVDASYHLTLLLAITVFMYSSRLCCQSKKQYIFMCVGTCIVYSICFNMKCHNNDNIAVRT